MSPGERTLTVPHITCDLVSEERRPDHFLVESCDNSGKKPSYRMRSGDRAWTLSSNPPGLARAAGVSRMPTALPDHLLWSHGRQVFQALHWLLLAQHLPVKVLGLLPPMACPSRRPAPTLEGPLFLFCSRLWAAESQALPWSYCVSGAPSLAERKQHIHADPPFLVEWGPGVQNQHCVCPQLSPSSVLCAFALLSFLCPSLLSWTSSQHPAECSSTHQNIPAYS